MCRKRLRIQLGARRSRANALKRYLIEEHFLPRRINFFFLRLITLDEFIHNFMDYTYSRTITLIIALAPILTQRSTEFIAFRLSRSRILPMGWLVNYYYVINSARCNACAGFPAAVYLPCAHCTLSVHDRKDGGLVTQRPFCRLHFSRREQTHASREHRGSWE